MGSEGQSICYSLYTRSLTQYPTTGSVKAFVLVCLSAHIQLSFSHCHSFKNIISPFDWQNEVSAGADCALSTWLPHGAGTTITSTSSCSQKLEKQISLSLLAPRRTPPPVVCACFLFKQHSSLDTRFSPSAGNVAMPHYAELSHRFLSKHFNCSMWERLGRGKKKKWSRGCRGVLRERRRG